MQIDHVLILCAGLGTRMGEIGKKLPKPLWPILNKTLLEIQINYCQSLGLDNIYINTHFLHDRIDEFVKKKNLKVKVLHEEVLLGSGGAIHNLGRQPEINFTGNVLLLNADVLFMLSKNDIEEEINNLEKNRAVLFAMDVGAKEKYNELVVNNNQLIAIEKAKGISHYITYSGIGIIKLNELERVEGYSNFFETVCNFKKEKIYISKKIDVEQWDFGTADHYLKNAINIIEDQESILKDFLKKSGVSFLEEKNFCNKELNSVDLESLKRFELNTIIGEGIKQKVN